VVVVGAVVLVEGGVVVGGGELVVAVGAAVLVVDDAVGRVDVVEVGSGRPVVGVEVEPVASSPAAVVVEGRATTTCVTAADRSGDGVSDTLLRTLPTAAVAIRIDTRVAATQAKPTAMRRDMAP